VSAADALDEECDGNSCPRGTAFGTNGNAAATRCRRAADALDTTALPTRSLRNVVTAALTMAPPTPNDAFNEQLVPHGRRRAPDEERDQPAPRTAPTIFRFNRPCRPVATPSKPVLRDREPSPVSRKQRRNDLSSRTEHQHE